MYNEKIYNSRDLRDFLNNQCKYEINISKTQKQILDSAIKVFSQKGFRGSRISDIAREANVSEGTIFNYYKSKKDLLFGLLVPISIDFLTPFLELHYEKNKLESCGENLCNEMSRLLVYRLKIISCNYPLLKTILVEAMYFEELFEILKEEIFPKLTKLIDRFVEGNIENNNFRNIDKSLISRSIISSLIGFIIFNDLVSEYLVWENKEEEMRKMIDVVLYGIAKENI
ncbi:TetR/AcrR family transcriptional regulator [Clostridium cylindrosporum]|uniref:Transcriptional regulator, TetR family n=1 Tax=Clostridium cylindrosporum DSM 605 TaxID=1121307 RepID=A0A0J8DGA8_CLOCY|nr:TetR/AcrR family transcriptional regulator [Clostridium cylindrosporum]KMT23203.1 transcriptional regulator, TetR family [Clostridium cylindrosporum DSM 605]